MIRDLICLLRSRGRGRICYADWRAYGCCVGGYLGRGGRARSGFLEGLAALLLVLAVVLLLQCGACAVEGCLSSEWCAGKEDVRSGYSVFGDLEAECLV